MHGGVLRQNVKREFQTTRTFLVFFQREVAKGNDMQIDPGPGLKKSVKVRACMMDWFRMPDHCRDTSTLFSISFVRIAAHTCTQLL